MGNNLVYVSSSWIGISCSVRHQRVTSITLPNLSLLGTIPPHIGNLSFLSSLNLINNSFQGHLPPEIGHLRRLKFIGLEFNNFTGEIPTSIGNLTMLKYLYLRGNIFTAIEATLWSIEWGIAEIVNHPEIQKKLRLELDAVLGPGVQITETDIRKLPYLQAVIKETLRLRMLIPLVVPPMNLHEAKLGGYDIPAESKILVNAWWLTNNPASWEKPEEFRPERFLEEEAKVEANGNDFRYLPFGVGRRSCPGIILALPILGITLGRLVQNFELLPPPGEAKIDTSEKGGQFSLHVLKHSTIVAKPISY